MKSKIRSSNKLKMSNSIWSEEEPLNTFKFNYKSKNKKIHIIFDPFTFSISLLIFVSILTCIVYYLLHFNLESEIKFYHQVVFNQTLLITQIEHRIMDQVLNSENIQKMNVIINNIEKISSQFNITQIQNNLEDIAKVINHYAPPLSSPINNTLL